MVSFAEVFGILWSPVKYLWIYKSSSTHRNTKKLLFVSNIWYSSRIIEYDFACCRDVNPPLIKCGWYNSSRSFHLILVTPLGSLAGGTEPGICLNFQGSFCLKMRFWNVLLLLLDKWIYIASTKRHFVFSVK